MFQLEPYRPSNVGTLTQLIGAGDRARAQAVLAGGAASAQAAQGIGNAVNGTLAQFMNYKIQEPRMQLEQAQVEQATRALADDKDARQAFTDAKGDPDKALNILEGKGNYNVAMKLRGQLQEQKIKSLDFLGKQLDTTEKRLSQAGQLLQSVPTAPDPAAAYKAVLPQVRTIVGDQLGGKLPDEYDESTVTRAMTWGMKAVDYARVRRDAATAAAQSVRSAVTKTELADKLTTSVAQWAQTVDSQEEWDRVRTNIKATAGDAADAVLANFPETFSADLPAKAAKLLNGKTKLQHETVSATVDGKTRILEANYDSDKGMWYAPGDRTTPLQDVVQFKRDPAGQVDVNGLTKTVLAHPEAFNDLTDSAKTAIWPSLSNAGFTAPPKADRGASTATAERWRMSQRAKVQNDVDLSVITPEQAKVRLNDIETSYRAQIGGASGSANPAAPQKPAGTPPAPPPPAAGAVPDDVQQLLANQPNGKKYKMSDGSIWIKDATGKISKGS